MKQIVITVYNIDELSEKAREKAYHNWLMNTDYHFSEDNRRTLEAFENIFPIRITSWQYDNITHFIEFEFRDSEEIEGLTGVRLLKYLYNNYYDYLYKAKTYYAPMKFVNGKPNYKSRISKIFKDNCCPLTGYWLDDVILKPIYEFMQKPNNNITFGGLMKKCLDAWGRACVKDYYDCTSMEYFLNYARENDLGFDESGNLII